MTTSTRTFKGRKYEDHGLECPICHRLFKNEQGRKAHIRQIHERITVGGAPVSAVREDGVDSISNLKKDVEQLKLLAEKRRLTAEFPTTKNESQDLMERLGLGAFEPEVRAQVQRRAMALANSEQGQREAWWEKLLSSPGGIQAAIEGLKGVLGVSHNNEGSSGLGVLKELGVDLKSLLAQSQSPKADASFEVAGLSLDGCSLTPELLASLVQFKAAEDSLTYQKSKDAVFQDGMQTIIKLVADSGLLNRLGGEIAKGSFGKRGAGDISQEIMPGGEPVGFAPFICPKCGASNELPEGFVLGQKIKCQCGEIYEVFDEGAQPKPARAKKQVKVNPPVVEETACPGCGQLLNLDGRSIGDVVRCSVCGDELTVNSETLAVPASEPLSEAEKQSKSFLRE